KDTDKIAFIKRVDLEIPEDRITVALKDVGLDVTDVIRLKNKERNTPTQTIKVTFTDAHNRNTFVHTGLQVDSMHFVAEAAKHNSKPSKQQTCARCGENHQVDKCNAAADTWKCCNCKGSHLATSNECPFYKEQEKRMLKAVQQYSTSSTPSTAVPYNVNNLVDFPYFPSSTQQGLTNPSNDLIDTLVNILSMKMEKIIEATANRLMKSLHQRISKIEKTIAAVDSMMDVASNETSDDSLTDSDNDIQVVNVQQDKQQQQTSQNSTTSSSTQQQPITTNDITKPPNKKKATSKTVKRNRSPNSSLDATTSNNKDIVDTHPTIGSSSGHKPLTFEVSIGAKHKSTSPRTSFNFKAANWTTFRKTLNDQLQLWNLSRTISTTVKIEEYNMFITNSLLEATHAAIPKLKQATSSYTISEATRNLINLKHHHYGK
ncbi:unnamed protein product, partial [Rotaria magnacalcarata]